MKKQNSWANEIEKNPTVEVLFWDDILAHDAEIEGIHDSLQFWDDRMNRTFTFRIDSTYGGK